MSREVREAEGMHKRWGALMVFQGEVFCLGERYTVEAVGKTETQGSRMGKNTSGRN